MQHSYVIEQDLTCETCREEFLIETSLPVASYKNFTLLFSFSRPDFIAVFLQ